MNVGCLHPPPKTGSIRSFQSLLEVRLVIIIGELIYNYVLQKSKKKSYFPTFSFKMQSTVSHRLSSFNFKSIFQIKNCQNSDSNKNKFQ